MAKRREVIIAWPDAHAPWINKPAVTRLLDLIEQEKPSVVVGLGDAYDCYSMSRFPRSQNLMTPKDELVEARLVLEELWRAIKKRAPKAKLYQLVGNHGPLRIQNKIFAQAPELEHLVNYKHLWEFPGVITQHEFRDPLILKHKTWGEIAFMHGFLSRPGAHVRHSQMHTVHGHLHSAWIHWEPIRNKSLFELNCGHISDPESKVMGYTKSRWTKWTIGCGLIDEHGPRFIPL